MVSKMLKMLKEKRAQISAEMIIVMAALLAVAVVLVKKLKNSAKNGANNLEKFDNNINADINEIIN